MKWSLHRTAMLCGCLSIACLAYHRLTRPVLVDSGITLEKAAMLKQGMAYDEVVDVIGCQPGTYNEQLKNVNPQDRTKGGQLTVEDADMSNASVLTDQYDHVYWRDYRDVQIKVMFTRNTRRVHRIDVYRYVPEENAFRYAR